MSNLLEEVEICISHLKDVENDLRRLQAATQILGFDQLTEDLHGAAVGIACQCVQLRKIAADDLDASFQEAKRNAAGILHAALTRTANDFDASLSGVKRQQ